MTEFLGILRPPRPTFAQDADEREMALMGDHFDYLSGLLEEGRLVMAGPALMPAFGLVIFEAEDQDAAWRIMRADPSVVAGLNTPEVYPYRVSLLRGRDDRAGDPRG